MKECDRDVGVDGTRRVLLKGTTAGLIGALGVLALLGALGTLQLFAGGEGGAGSGGAGRSDGPATGGKDSSTPGRAAGEPALIRPTADRRQSGPYPKGEVLLFRLLQGVADASGIPVCYQGDDPPDTTIHLSRSMESADAKSAGAVLLENGFELSAAEYRGEKVNWVQRLLVSTRQRGRIVRSGEAEERTGSAHGGSETGASAESSVALYERQAGGGRRFVVILETTSRKEADDALSLLEAHRRSRAERGGKDAAGAGSAEPQRPVEPSPLPIPPPRTER
ncbi:MAG TPA: hypothetical protein VFD71_19690 [Planctomycetota bacterium]|nr:hypothetical protein [Planctomycetota bacterium]